MDNGPGNGNMSEYYDATAKEISIQHATARTADTIYNVLLNLETIRTPPPPFQKKKRNKESLMQFVCCNHEKYETFRTELVPKLFIIIMDDLDLDYSYTR